MPQAKLKPSDIAAEAKRIYIPYIEQHLPQFPARSYFYGDTSELRVTARKDPKLRPRIAVIDGDPVDVALDWHGQNYKDSITSGTNGYTKDHGKIPVVSMANEKRAGGDWESGLIAPEECLCRRSNLVRALTTSFEASGPVSHYPIPPTGGIYSPNVVIFRSRAEGGYSVWKNFKSLPIISVAPIRRPKLDDSGCNYSFDQEKELMKEKMRAVLRIAAAHNHRDLCMGAFGVGPGFRNPVTQVATMWRELLFSEDEFKGIFSNVVFAIESSSSSSTKGGLSDYEIFKREFHPSIVVPSPRIFS